MEKNNREVLNETTVDNYKNEFIKIIEHCYEADLAARLEQIAEKTDFYSAPYTTQYKDSVEGGLCAHSVKTFYELKRLVSIYAPDKYTDTNIANVALFKDFYKAYLYEKQNSHTKVNNQWVEVVKFGVVDPSNRPIFGDVNFSSYMMFKDTLQFSLEEIEAICNSSLSTSNIDIFNIMREYPLVSLTKMAEIAVSFIY